MDQEARRTEDLAQVIKRLLDAVERGEIEAVTPQAQRLLRRLEGALAAAESLHEHED